MSAITFSQRGFVIRCRARDLPSLLASLREKYGEAVIFWGKNILKQ